MLRIKERPLLSHSHPNTVAANFDAMMNKDRFEIQTCENAITSNSLLNFGDTNCLEKLLVHYANAIENNDATLAKEIFCILNNLAPSDGDSNQRLTWAFLRALTIRAMMTGSFKVFPMPCNETDFALHTHKFSILELTTFVDLTPWYRFGFSAANSAIVEAVEGYHTVHIVDFGITHCMQIPTLIDSLANRPQGPPVIRLTVVKQNDIIPPVVDISYDELSAKLLNFARSRNVRMDFRVIPSNFTDGFSSLMEQLRVQRLIFQENTYEEALVINCQMLQHYVPDDALGGFSSLSCRSILLKEIRSLDPNIVILVDEDADFSSINLATRLRSAFNFLWIPYDTIDTFLSKESKHRQWYESSLCWKIQNIIALEGSQRVERLEPKSKWIERMRSARFYNIPFGEETVAEVKQMLDEHAVGWGLKREDEDLVLTWKGHNTVFATAWIPI